MKKSQFPFYTPPEEELCKKLGAISVTLRQVVLCRDVPHLNMRVRVLWLLMNPDIGGVWRRHPNPPTSWLLAISGKTYTLIQEGVSLEAGNSATDPTTAAALLIGQQTLHLGYLAESDPDALPDALREAAPMNEVEEILDAGVKEEEEDDQVVASTAGEDGEPVNEEAFSEEPGQIDGQEIVIESADDFVFENEEEAVPELPPPPPKRGGRRGKNKA